MKSIINTYDQLNAAVTAGIIPKEQAVAVFFHPARSVIPSRCIVCSPFFKTDPSGAAWYDHGDKAFSGRKAESVIEAMAWASKTYGITDWAGNRMRDKVPAIVQKRLPIPKRAD